MNRPITFWRYLTRAILPAAGILAVMGIAMAPGCSNSFLDDFPVYAPTEPFLEDRAESRLRVSGAEMARARAIAEALARAHEESLLAWHYIQDKQRDGLRRQRQRASRDTAVTSLTSQERSSEWDQIMR